MCAREPKCNLFKIYMSNVLICVYAYVMLITARARRKSVSVLPCSIFPECWYDLIILLNLSQSEAAKGECIIVRRYSLPATWFLERNQRNIDHAFLERREFHAISPRMHSHVIVRIFGALAALPAFVAVRTSPGAESIGRIQRCNEILHGFKMAAGQRH